MLDFCNTIPVKADSVGLRRSKDTESGQVTSWLRQAHNEAVFEWNSFLPVLAKTSSAAFTAAPCSNGPLI